MKKTRLAYLALLSMAMIPLLAPISAEPLVPQTFYLLVDNNRPYLEDNLWERYVPFWYVAGENITWWNGGMEFVYKTPIAQEKVETITTKLLTMFRELGFITVVGATEPEELHLTYVFDGILEYEGYLFLDHSGRIVIDYVKGGDLKITIYAKATVNKTASTIYSIGGDNQDIWNRPTATITVLKMPVEILAVPRDGIIKQDMARGPVKTIVQEKTIKEYDVESGWNCEPWFHHESWCDSSCWIQRCVCCIFCRPYCHLVETTKTVKTYSYVRDKLYPIYLGGAPKLTVLKRIGSILDPSDHGSLPHASVKAGDTWWHRQPVYTIIFDEAGNTILKHDLYYGHSYKP